MKYYFKYILPIVLILAITTLDSCRKRDCRGRKKTVKTNMGGWL